MFLSACSKRSSEEKDFEPPVIIINTPASSQLYTSGQTISITGSVSDNKYITEIHVHVTNMVTEGRISASAYSSGYSYSVI